MQKARAFRHSGLFYRNTVIVWLVTFLVMWTALTAARHWVSMLIVLVGLCLSYFLWATYRSVHPGKSIFRRRSPQSDVDLNAEKVAFLGRDGLQLYGWFLPGEKRQVVILLHGLGGTGLSMSSQARMLHKAGYNVLMPELRAHGDSEGDTITGTLEVNDVLGALDYLATRPKVDANQVGILGVSFGALIALRTARQTPAIKAVVLESIGPATLADHGRRPTTLRSWFKYPFNWLLYSFFDFMSGVDEREGVVESLHLIYPRPVLFISTGRGKEHDFIRKFYEAARQPKSLLEVSRAPHEITASDDFRAYRERLLMVFSGAFGDG